LKGWGRKERDEVGEELGDNGWNKKGIFSNMEEEGNARALKLMIGLLPLLERSPDPEMMFPPFYPIQRFYLS
jgi:hypothetical protein